MKSNIIITLFYLLIIFNVKGQVPKNINYKNTIIGEWIFSQTEAGKDSIVNDKMPIKRIIFFANGNFTINGDKKEIIGKFKIDSTMINFYSAFVNGKKSEKEYRFSYSLSNSKKLTVEFMSELGNRNLIFTKK
jgi:hypothetical protein